MAKRGAPGCPNGPAEGCRHVAFGVLIGTELFELSISAVQAERAPLERIRVKAVADLWQLDLAFEPEHLRLEGAPAGGEGDRETAA
jgi:hypothetical protein